MRSAVAVFIGFVVWWLCYVCQLLTSVLLLNYSVDNYLSYAVISFFGTTIGLILGSVAMKRIYYKSGRRELLILVALIAMWMGSSLIDGTDRIYRFMAFGGAMLAATIAIKQRGWEI